LVFVFPSCWTLPAVTAGCPVLPTGEELNVLQFPFPLLFHGVTEQNWSEKEEGLWPFENINVSLWKWMYCTVVINNL